MRWVPIQRTELFDSWLSVNDLYSRKKKQCWYQGQKYSQKDLEIIKLQQKDEEEEQEDLIDQIV